MGLFGGKTKLKSTNFNQALVTNAYTPQMQQGTQANNFLSSLLTGTGDTGAAQQGYNNYLQMAGFAPAMRQLSQGITGQGAASGLLRSGSTANALMTKGAELNQSFANNYLQQLAGLSGLGLQAGGLVTNAGQGELVKKKGLLGSIASAAGAASSLFSDRRLKRDIELIGREPDGLGIYSFRYVMTVKRFIGVMADEVAALRPWALGPEKAGFATVNYGVL